MYFWYLKDTPVSPITSQWINIAVIIIIIIIIIIITIISINIGNWYCNR